MRLNREILLLGAETFEFMDAFQQTVNFNRTGDVTVRRKHSARYADNHAVRRHNTDNYCIGANASVTADDDGAKNFRSGADHDAAAHRGVTFATRKKPPSERCSVVHRHVVTNDCGFTNHDTESVIDKKPLTNG